MISKILQDYEKKVEIEELEKKVNKMWFYKINEDNIHPLYKPFKFYEDEILQKYEVERRGKFLSFGDKEMMFGKGFEKNKKKRVGKGLRGRRIKSKVNYVENYNEEDEGIDTEEDNNVREEGTSKALVHRKVESPTKRRRGIDTEADKAYGKGQETPLHA